MNAGHADAGGQTVSDGTVRSFRKRGNVLCADRQGEKGVFPAKPVCTATVRACQGTSVRWCGTDKMCHPETLYANLECPGEPLRERQIASVRRACQ